MVRKFFLEEVGKIDQGLGFRIRVNQPKNAFWSQITEDVTQTDLKNKVNLFSHMTKSPKQE